MTKGLAFGALLTNESLDLTKQPLACGDLGKAISRMLSTT